MCRRWLRYSSTSLLCSLLILSLSLNSGCSKPPRGDRKTTVPVTGKVQVDGKSPGSQIKIMCHNKAGEDTAQPSVSWCLTDNEGVFALSTYESGDGVPPGEYVLTFYWGKMNNVSMSYGGPDQLNKKYDEPKKSPVEFQAQEEPVDLGTIELTTKK